MSPLRRIILVLLVLLATVRWSRARQLLADGSDAGMWVASTVTSVPEGDPRTSVWARQTGSTQWDGLYQISSYPVSLTHQRTQPVLLIDNGQWMFLFAGGRSLGPPAPGGGKIVTLSTTGETLLAVASIPGGLAAVSPAHATTAPSTTTAAGAATTEPGITTAPTSRAVPPSRLVLMALRDMTWQPLAELAGVDPLSRVSVLGSASRTLLAVQQGDDEVRVAEWSEGQLPVPLSPIKFPGRIGDFKIVSAGEQPLVWVAAGTGAGTLFQWNGTAWGPGVDLSVGADLSQPAPRDIASTSRDRVRLVYRKGEKNYQQVFDVADGKPVSDPDPIVAVSRDPADAPQSHWFSVGVMTMLAFVLLSAMKRQELIHETMERRSELHLAPMFRRFAAGLIDLSPLLITAVVVCLPHARAGETRNEIAQDPTVLRPIAIALAAYLAHVAVGEVLFSRSIGKWLFGLRVVNMKGDRAAGVQVIVRNVFRVVDLFVIFLSVLANPLRQRLGDMAAGTLVVTNEQQPVGDRADSK